MLAAKFYETVFDCSNTDANRNKCKWSYPGFNDQKLTLTLAKESSTAKTQISNFLSKGNLALKKSELESSLLVDSTPLLETHYDTNEGYESWRSNWNQDPRKHKSIPEVYGALLSGKRWKHNTTYQECKWLFWVRWKWNDLLNACGDGEKKPKKPNKPEKESKEDVGKQLTVERQDTIAF